MTVKGFFIVCCILTLGAAWGQPGAAVADPISGTWTGEFVPDGGESVPVTFQLKFDGKGAVSGTFTGLPTPGDVKTGTFDPATGALKLELSKQGESVVRLVLEGAVSTGTATGGITGETGEERIASMGPAATDAETLPVSL